MIITIIALICLGAHAYIRPSIDMDRENNQIIIHYWWRKVRKTYVIK